MSLPEFERWVANGKNDDGNMIFVQSDDRRADEAKSLRLRAEAVLGSKLGSDETGTLSCKKWIDVRTFGQLFALKSTKKTNKKVAEDENEGDAAISIGIRGPVTIQSAFSIEPIDITSIQITKSVNSEGDGTKPHGPPQPAGMGDRPGDAGGVGGDRHQQPRRLREEL